MSWQSIETAPKDGSRVLCWAKSFDRPCILIWKTNHRIVDAHKAGEAAELAESYFGDEDEYDDYELAEEAGGPTHWFPFPLPS